MFVATCLRTNRHDGLLIAVCVLESSAFVGETVQEGDLNEWKQCVCLYVKHLCECAEVYAACFLA